MDCQVTHFCYCLEAIAIGKANEIRYDKLNGKSYLILRYPSI